MTIFHKTVYSMWSTIFFWRPTSGEWLSKDKQNYCSMWKILSAFGLFFRLALFQLLSWHFLFQSRKSIKKDFGISKCIINCLNLAYLKCHLLDKGIITFNSPDSYSFTVCFMNCFHSCSIFFSLQWCKKRVYIRNSIFTPLGICRCKAPFVTWSCVLFNILPIPYLNSILH